MQTEARCPRCHRLFYLEWWERIGHICCICKRDVRYEALYGFHWRNIVLARGK
jgi:hypothetical protein